jgi:hypothetical protein
MRRMHDKLLSAVLVLGCCSVSVALAQDAQPSAVLFENVRVFDGKSERLSPPSNVLEDGDLEQRRAAGAVGTAQPLWRRGEG